jgi:hypothetical protein
LSPSPDLVGPLHYLAPARLGTGGRARSSTSRR